MRKTRIILSKIANLIELIEESNNIFFEERPFLENPNEAYIIKPLEERREENEIKIRQAIKEISSELGDEFPEKTQKTEQKRIFPMAEPINVVILKPLYNDFVTVREDTYILNAIRENRKLKISSPDIGECLVTPEEWKETGKRIEKEFKIKGRPMILWGNNIKRFS